MVFLLQINFSRYTLDLKKISTKKANFEIIAPGIIEVYFKQDVKIEREDVLEFFRVIQLLSKDKPFCLLVKGKYFIEFGHATGKLGSDFGKIKNRGVIAVVTENLATRLMVRFYMRYFKPNTEVKIFFQENEAIQWLEEVLKREKVT